MKFSIITAAYNSIQHLPAVMESIAGQRIDDLEWIVIDGGSTDGTLPLLKKNKKINQLVSEPDQGIYDALNKGINLATGDVIGFLHSDDLFCSSETLHHISTAFSEKEVSVVYGDLVFIDQTNDKKVVRYWKSQPFRPELLKRGWMPPHPTIFMRREVYEKHGRFNIDLKCSADYDYVLRVFLDPALKFVYLPEVITKMRKGGMSTTGLKNLITKKREDYRVLKNNKMPNPFLILLVKNFSKIPQLLHRNLES
jgi:glycosyltransferase